MQYTLVHRQYLFYRVSYYFYILRTQLFVCSFEPILMPDVMIVADVRIDILNHFLDCLYV